MRPETQNQPVIMNSCCAWSAKWTGASGPPNYMKRPKPIGTIAARPTRQDENSPGRRLREKLIRPIPVESRMCNCNDTRSVPRQPAPPAAFQRLQKLPSMLSQWPSARNWESALTKATISALKPGGEYPLRPGCPHRFRARALLSLRGRVVE
ncbi:hypothetical protein VTK73DRAFT_1955 [Phialemonium thermophilum]|uniref:Uncharacterized protein n=1 Tax=Phialemonium thermophilum TaxID=223376 RepID=A0ABR3X6Q0_9PEZI